MTVASLKHWVFLHSVLLGLIWGFAEGSFFFIVPDVIITLVALFSLKRSLQCMAAVLAGSLIAGTGLFFFSQLDSLQAQSVVQSVPFVQLWMFTKVQIDFAQHGVLAMLMGPSSGIPYKIYATLAPDYTTFVPFILTSIPARLERFLITWSMFAFAGHLLRHKRDQHVGAIFTIHLLYWAAVYAYYLTVVIHGN